MEKKVFIIAEIGPNHNGDLNLALDMIDELSKIGVDAIKFQLVNPEKIYSKDSFKADYQVNSNKKETALELSKKNQLCQEDHFKLFNKCQENNVDYLCTGFDLESMIFLDTNFDLKYFKIASGEIFSLDIIEYISTRNKPIILSTGMATYSEIETSINLLNRNFKKDITILHCVSNYPALYNNVNLNNIIELKNRFLYPTGFSDHTIGNECAIAAVAMGASMIEKHVTIDKNLPGPDHKASITISEFADLVQSIRNVELALGTNQRIISAEEKETYHVARKSIVSKRDLEKGEIIKEKDICYKRPGTGFLPIEKNCVIGKKVTTRIEKDRVIAQKNIK